MLDLYDYYMYNHWVKNFAKVGDNMNENIQPNYHDVTVVCACGASFVCGTTKDGDTIKVEVCSKCHPYYTGKQKLVDTGGRVEKFKKRYSL